MIIKFIGETSLNKLPKIVKEITADIQSRAGIEGSKFTVKDVELGLLFNVNGEKMMLSSEVDGVVEPFKIYVELDEKGNVKAKKDNENESFMDEYSKAISRGEEKEYAEIESEFEDSDLEEVEVIEAFDMKEVKYRIKGSDEMAVRYYKNGLLVGEYAYKQKEGN